MNRFKVLIVSSCQGGYGGSEAFVLGEELKDQLKPIEFYAQSYRRLADERR
ncbi:MAG: hypothetical protein ABI946_02060 [Chthoniobacterales bacterium]